MSVAKIRVGVVYGGRSGEHEVSIASAASVFKHIDRSRYEPVPIRIEKDGRWVLPSAEPKALSAGEVIRQAPSTALQPLDPTAAVSTGVDVVFPVLHGPYGEDGTVQGLLELANVAYVGCGVLASAVGMDKAVMKTMFAARGLPVVAPYIVVLRHEWERERDAITARVAGELRYPVFVKPANLGSSVGISKAKSDASLADGMTLALQFDRKVVIEAAVPNAREIEVAVLGNDDPQASVPGEIVPSREFYDYEAKYLDEGSQPLIPAPLTDDETRRVRAMAIEAFRAIDGAGLSRVDFLIARDSGDLYVNEVNTLPGFTTISMYPKMWEASGRSYPALLDRLITLALERHAAKTQLKTSII